MSGTSRRNSPPLGFTSGDPAGIGPRCVIRALRSGAVPRGGALLIGETSVWRRAGWTPGLAPVLDTGLRLAPPPFGRPTAAGGAASFAALDLGIRLAGRRLIGGLVTAPISKTAWALAGIPYRDHTQVLRERTGAPAQMLLGLPGRALWSVLATRHIPLARVAAELSPEGVLAAAEALSGALALLTGRRPRLGLCGLNPHAGEEGLLGREERTVLASALASARRRRLDLRGPVAADAAWRAHLEGDFDGLVCLYHDQALIALKTAGGLGVVNWTAGLPFVRVSPGHGTGYDIAGKREPDHAATAAAARLALRLGPSA